MWTVMAMTLHTLQFNPIIDILTQKKVTKENIYFFGRELRLLLCLALVSWWGPMTIPSAPKRRFNSSRLIWM